jgi:hypothetical protein
VQRCLGQNTGLHRPEWHACIRGFGEASTTADAHRALSDYGIPVAPISIGLRAALAHALVDGRAVNEFDPAGKAAVEMNNLWQLYGEAFMGQRPSFGALKKKKPLLEVVTPAEDNPATAEPKPAPRIQTSVRLDPVMWAALNDLATRKRV